MRDFSKFRIDTRPPRRQVGDGTDTTPVPSRGIQDIVQRYATQQRSARCLVLFDATGSMQPYWNHLCGTLHRVVNRLLSVHQDLLLKIVAYRDECDGDRVIVGSEWTRDNTALGAFVGNCRCDGGGDWPEAVDRALAVALDEHDVSAVVLIGDAPPHAERDGRDEAQRLGALTRPVFPIVVGDAADTRAAFQEIARLSGGRRLDLERLDELFDVLAAVLAYAGGPEVLADYVARFEKLLTPGGRRAVRMLTDGRR